MVTKWQRQLSRQYHVPFKYGIEIYNNASKNQLIHPCQWITYILKRLSCLTTSHVCDMSSVIVLTSCVCVCVYVCGFTEATSCTISIVYGDLVHHWAQYAPPKRNVHHGAHGRLYFLENSVCPDTHKWNCSQEKLGPSLIKTTQSWGTSHVAKPEFYL